MLLNRYLSNTRSLTAVRDERSSPHRSLAFHDIAIPRFPLSLRDDANLMQCRVIPIEQRREALDSFSWSHQGWIVRVAVTEPSGRSRVDAKDIEKQVAPASMMTDSTLATDEGPSADAPTTRRALSVQRDPRRRARRIANPITPVMNSALVAGSGVAANSILSMPIMSAEYPTGSWNTIDPMFPAVLPTPMK